MQKGLERKESTYRRIQGSLRRKVKSVKHFVDHVSEDLLFDEENHKDDFVDYFAREGHLCESQSVLSNGGSIEAGTKDPSTSFATFQQTLRRRKRISEHSDDLQKQVSSKSEPQQVPERAALEKSLSGPMSLSIPAGIISRPLSVQSKIVIYDDPEVEEDEEGEMQSVSVQGENSIKLLCRYVFITH